MRTSIWVRIFDLSDNCLDKFFAAGLQCPSPKLAVGCKAGNERIEAVPLPVGQRPIVGNAFYLRFEPCPRLQRSAFRSSVEKNIEVDLQLSDAVFETQYFLV